MAAELMDGPRTLSALVERQAGLVPDAPAVRTGRRWMTYAELDAAATRLARRLAARGVGPEDVVGVRTGRGFPLVVALLGVVKAGAAWLALPRDLPAARVAGLVRDAGAAALVAVPELRQDLPELPCPVLPVDERGGDPSGVEGEEDGAEAPPLPPIDPAWAAYVIYTSGSTGVPKGVVVEHGAAAGHVAAMAERLGTGFGDGVLQMAGEAFDVAVEQLFVALASGAMAVLREDEPWGPAELCRELRKGLVTVADLPTALFSELVRSPEPGNLPAFFTHVRTVLVGGEALPAGSLRRWRAAFAAADAAPEVGNAYGPTEAVMTASLWTGHGGGTGSATDDGAGSVPVGTVVGARVLRLLDGELCPVGDGTPGELYVGGEALARGYLGRPELTAERFVPDPYGPPGARMYRTGDRMTGAEGGELTFLGRADDQVKVRGFRIEPGEVEAALTGHPAIGQAAVVADGDRLGAFLVSAEAGSRLPFTAVRAWLGERLPAWMVPATWAWLDRLPVGASGKVDKAALPRPDAARSGTGRPCEPPRDETQRALCAIWARVLNLPEAGIHDDFFELGGTSLLAARALAEVRSELAADLPLRALFAAPTPLGLSEALGGGAADDPAALPPVVRGEPAGTGPLSLMQRQVWIAEQFSTGGSAYNAPTTLRLHGPLDLGVLERTLTEIVRRHEILRTTVEVHEGEPRQVVHPPYEVRVPLVDLREETDPRAAAEEFVRADIALRFDIGRLPLIRWTALRLAEETYELVLVEHHLVHDGWSFALLMDELSRIYTAFAEGHGSPLPEPEAQYQDFARWQRQALAGPALRAQTDRWRARLAGAPQQLDLPYDGRRAAHDDTRGAVHRMELPAALCERLRRFSGEHHATLYATMLAGYAALLHRYSGQDEVCVGSAFGNRGVPGTAGILGMFVNPVVLRCAVRRPGETAPGFAELVARARQVVLEAQADQELPFVELIRELDPPRSPGRNPVFQAMLNFDDSPLPELRLGPVAGSYLERNNGTAKVDLSVLVVPRAERQLGVPDDERDRRITLIWEYRTDLFGPDTVRRLAEGYAELLDAALARPGEPVTELPAGRPAPHAPAVPVPDLGEPATVPELFAAVVGRCPERTAVTLPSGDALSYAELDRGSDRIAAALAERGIGAGDVVALHLPRSPELVAGMLGVLKAGAAYLPLDTGSPAARLRDVLADARPPLVLTDSADGTRLGPPALRVDEPGAVPEDATAPAPRPHPGTLPGELAYLIYTSGSTGRPKGVGITHHGLTDKYRAWELAYRLDGAPARHLQLASVAFDVCTGDVFRALLSGGTLVLCPPETLLDPARLLALLREERVDHAEFLPSVLRLLMDHAERAGETLPPLALLAVGGEAWDAADYRRLRALTAPATRILNVYGVTEATVGSTFHEPDGDEPGVLPLGGPLPGVRALVLDGAGRPVAPGMVGGIHLGGTGLARGYHADPARTAERFVPDPDPAHPGGRLYDTGDLGRVRADGTVEYLGRRDQQVKVRGFRVEPAEIEQALREHPALSEAVVVPRPGEDGTRLVAYCVPAPAVPSASAAPGTVREWLRDRVPGYLVPSAFVVLDALPRTVSGKLDRGALPEPGPGPAGPEAEQTYTAPRTTLERAVAEVWQQVLGVRRVGLRDDFFDLGGHSLLAVRLVGRMRDDLGLDLSVRDLITEATVEGAVRRAGPPDAEADAVALTARGRHRMDPALFDDDQETAG
ncbi:amino acid adenylation domain-containing protein [Streptomyces sp. NPDC048172]|uniref:amino acid adenylation domain-containing protein n=1 Tax=Streptomyces sp. NPDC048172 TaxID=3365505 RepID=UPI003719ABBA